METTETHDHLHIFLQHHVRRAVHARPSGRVPHVQHAHKSCVGYGNSRRRFSVPDWWAASLKKQILYAQIVKSVFILSKKVHFQI